VTRVALVHPTSLIGNELRQLLARPECSGWETRLLSVDDEEVGQVTEAGGAAAFVGRVDELAFDELDLAFFCGPLERDRRAAATLPASVPAVFAATGAGAEDGRAAIAGVRESRRAGSTRLVSAHPAAVALGLLLDPLGALGLRSARATVALPVSHGEDDGIEELFEETRRLLSFQSPTPRGKARGRQVAYNLAADDAESDAIAAATREALADEDLPLAVQAVRAGVFHGLALQLWVELDEPPSAAELRRRLGSAPAVELARRTATVDPVGVAGGERLVVGAVRAAGTGAFGVWAVLDNLLRGGALNALELGLELLGQPAG